MYFTMYTVFFCVRICYCSAVSGSMFCSQTDTAFVIDDSRMVGIIFAFSATRAIWACTSQVICFPTVETGQYPFIVILLLLGIRLLSSLSLLMSMIRLLIFVRLLFVGEFVFRGFPFDIQFS